MAGAEVGARFCPRATDAGRPAILAVFSPTSLTPLGRKKRRAGDAEPPGEGRAPDSFATAASGAAFVTGAGGFAPLPDEWPPNRCEWSTATALAPTTATIAAVDFRIAPVEATFAAAPPARPAAPALPDPAAA
ncbi:MAG: hypothetical protein JST53_04170, partial [Actinobacteria bacterium]|nr:hypothetical protein [Actinomycetota bacterium]